MARFVVGTFLFLFAPSLRRTRPTPKILISIVTLLVLILLGVPAPAELPSFVPQLIVERVDETKLTVLKGNTHPLARPQFDRGPAPPDLPMNRMLLVLKRSPEQEGALVKLLDDQQDKDSPSYHKWLTPEQFGKQFGPADEDIQTVTAWLESHGFEIAKVVKGRNIIEFSGTASQVQETFHTPIHKYVVNGEEHWANANDPEIPTALTPVVAGVHTLHNFLKKPMIHIAERKIEAHLTPQGPGKNPLVTFPANPPLHALGPADFATIYNVNPLFAPQPAAVGLGFRMPRLAVVGRSNINTEDVVRFNSVLPLNGLNTAEAPFVILNGPDPGDLGGGEEAEAVLDNSWSGALLANTPSTVFFVVSASTNTTDGIDLSEVYIVDNNLADIMTESFGSCEGAYVGNSAEVQGIETLAQQAAAQGITYLVAAGDSGAEGCDNPDTETIATGPLSVNILASTPYTVAVGGTMFNEDGQDSKYWGSNESFTLESAISYIPENVWNESCTAAQCGKSAGIWAGGGGVSRFFKKPSWQSGVNGIPNDGARDLPDVSLTAAADHDPYLICLDGSCVPDAQGNIFFVPVGGTSASTPAFAGIMALVDATAGSEQGQANYVLYRLAAAEKLSQCNASSTTGLPASSCIFNDVTVGNNAVPGEPGYGNSTAQYQSGVGYDLATGLGSVNVFNLVTKWNTATFKPTTTAIVNLSPTTITHGQAVDVSVTVAPNSGGGIPSGSVSLIAIMGDNPQQESAVGSLSLVNGTASGSTRSLPGGTYPITAQYSGDGTFANSASAPSVPVTVVAENSATTLSALTLDANYNFIPFTGGAYGSFAYLRADVTGQSKQGTPTGGVNFIDGTSSLGTYALNSEGNTATPNFLTSPNGGTPTGLYTLSLGPHSITAAYQGDASFNQSTSPAVNLTITPASTTTAVASAAAAQGATLTATVNTGSGGNPPTGTVTFLVNSSQVGSPVAVNGIPALTTQTGTLQGAQATASYTDSALVNGTSYNVKATYNGDSNYRSSVSPSVPVTLQSDFSLSASTDTVSIASPGANGTLTVAITALDGYKGTINFSSSSCSGLPTGSTCSFSPSSVTGGGTTKLTVSTTAATISMLRPGTNHRLGWWAAVSGAGLAGLIWLGVPTKRRRSADLLTLVLCALIVTGIGCGGGSSNSTPPPPPPPTPTPAGSYTVTMTVSSGALTHELSFTLTVQ